MPDNGTPYKTHILFKKVHEAREALRLRAVDIISEYMDVAKQAKAAGDYESAYKALQWLIEHMPAADDGTRIIDNSPDKAPPVQQAQNTGPTIQVGIVLGGINDKIKRLPKAEVIDAKPE